MNIAADRNLKVIGYICQCARQTVRGVSKAAEALGIAPALVLDNLVYYTEEDCERIVAHFRGEQEAFFGGGKTPRGGSKV